MPITIEFEGEPVTPWLFRLEGEVLERLEWLTGVIPAFDGSEQRTQLRLYPRRYFEFAHTLTEQERRIAENLLHARQAGVWAVPVWMDLQHLEAPLAIGSSSVPVTPATRDYHVGGYVGLMTGPTTYEILEVATIGGSSVTTDTVTEIAWPAGAMVFPVRLVRMPDQLQLRRFTGAVATGRFRYRTVDDNAYTAATESTTHRSYPVLTIKPNWSEDPRQDLQRQLALVDAGTGGQYVDDESGGPAYLQSHRWFLNGRTEIDAFRQWLYARKGRLSAFWMPTWAQDLVVVEDIGSSDTTIDVEYSGYADQVAQGIGRRDIRIELRDGTVFYRRITASTELSPTVERLTIASSLGSAVDADAVALVSFLHLVRLNADGAEIQWWTWEVAEAALTVRGMRNDL